MRIFLPRTRNHELVASCQERRNISISLVSISNSVHEWTNISIFTMNWMISMPIASCWNQNYRSLDLQLTEEWQCQTPKVSLLLCSPASSGASYQHAMGGRDASSRKTRFDVSRWNESLSVRVVFGKPITPGSISESGLRNCIK